MIYLVWDASDIWGLLAAWGIRGLGIASRIVTAADVASGLLKRERPSVLLLPGGFSRHKAAALAPAGQEAIREYVASGGLYLGVCGGAGLALTSDTGLGLCPWQRVGYENRIQHAMSGHFSVTQAEHVLTPHNLASPPLLPVWWPGRFAPPSKKTPEVTVLAAYDTPGDDFWLADLPVASLPEQIFADWEKRYAFSPSPSFLHGQACILHGRYGKGDYVLTYSHLETPRSPDANAWLAHILKTAGGERPERTEIPAWNLDECIPAWEDSGIESMWADITLVMQTGLNAGLFFSRSSWLMGWRIGTPGAVLGAVRAQLHTIRSLPASPAALALWRNERETLVPAFHVFAKRAVSYLLAKRLSLTLAHDLPETLIPKALLKEREEIFGATGMAGHTGGLLGALLPNLDTLARLQLQGQ